MFSMHCQNGSCKLTDILLILALPMDDKLYRLEKSQSIFTFFVLCFSQWNILFDIMYIISVQRISGKDSKWLTFFYFLLVFYLNSFFQLIFVIFGVLGVGYLLKYHALLCLSGITTLENLIGFPLIGQKRRVDKVISQFRRTYMIKEFFKIYLVFLKIASLYFGFQLKIIYLMMVFLLLGYNYPENPIIPKSVFNKYKYEELVEQDYELEIQKRYKIYQRIYDDKLFI